MSWPGSVRSTGDWVHGDDSKQNSYYMHSELCGIQYKQIQMTKMYIINRRHSLEAPAIYWMTLVDEGFFVGACVHSLLNRVAEGSFF